MIAFIDEENCVGCARCLPVCPVDAIIGAPVMTHTVIAEECIGCGLCIDPCPMDCIKMLPANISVNPEKAKYRHLQKRLRTTPIQLPPPSLASLRTEIRQVLSRCERRPSD